MPVLMPNEQKRLIEIEAKYYFSPVLNKIIGFIESKENKSVAWKECFDQIYKFLTNSKDEVDLLLEQRKKNGLIKNIEQARKSIVGSLFSELFIYVFLKNKEIGNIKSEIMITSRPSEVPEFEKYSTIYVDGETQKPDCDLVIYALTNGHLHKMMILSLKTSLRERAGQTYKWKLLLEIATSNNIELKEKYGLRYDGQNMPLIGFATVNFYNEINQPQHRGMFKFFDKTFIAKDIKTADFISNLSTIIDYLEEVF